MNHLKEPLNSCKSFSEACRLLGYDYYNSRVKQKVVSQCKLLGIDIEKIVSDYNNRKVYCLCCGNEITGKDRFIKKFCSSSCSATYNNKLRPKKRKRPSNDLTRKIKEYKAIRDINHLYFKSIRDCLSEGLILNPYNVQVDGDALVCKRKYTERVCDVCGMVFKPYFNEHGNLYKGKTCSSECLLKKRGEAGKLGYQSQVDKGTFKGWQSRNILSFPEKFWINVLDNNNIKYAANKPFKGYFLDFYIEIGERKIDLEIDGGQHKLPDRALSDKIRDKVVKESGIEVYRIEWNEVGSDKGKEKMKEKIDMFLKFIG